MFHGLFESRFGAFILLDFSEFIRARENVSFVQNKRTTAKRRAVPIKERCIR